MKKKMVLLLVLAALVLSFVACQTDTPIQHILSVNVVGNGTVYPNGGYYSQGALVTLQVQPASGWIFEGWEGNNRYEVFGEKNTWQIYMTDSKNLTAVFKASNTPDPGEPGDPGQPEQRRQLNVTVEGRGSVNPSSGTFTNGELVYLNVLPERGWQFDRWEGQNRSDVIDASGNYAICMDTDKSLIAVFKENNFKLYIETVGEGTVEERAISGEYPQGTLVRLQAKPANKWIFKEWRGDANGRENITTIELDRDKHVTAVFEKAQVNYSLTVKVVGKGKVDEKLVSDNEYPENSIILLTAKPNAGWLFDGWTGDIRDNKSEVYVELDRDKTVTAKFIEEDKFYTLDVEIVGRGRVTKSPDYGEYEEYEVVTLRAIPNDGWEFDQWRGDAKGSNTQVKVTMDEDKEVTAVFVEIERYKLDVSVEGNGRVTKNPDSSDYEEGSRVDLKASPDNGWDFKEWRGDASGTSTSTYVTMDNNKKVIAVFEKREVRYKLNVNTSGSGSVSKNPNSGDYLEGSTVTLTASPSAGWLFKNWSGDASGSSSSVQVTMDRDKNVTAIFEQEPAKRYTLTTRVGGGSGSITRSPNQSDYEEGTVVEVRGVPSANYQVSYWTCDGQRYDAQGLRITMNNNRTAVCYFAYRNTQPSP